MEPDSNEALRRLEIDQTLAEHDLDRRGDVRVAPEAEHPVLLRVGPDDYELRDISVSGLSFYSHEVFDCDFWLMGILELPAPAKSFEITLQIVACEAGGLVRCQFMDIQPQDASQLSDYIDKRLNDIAKTR